MKLNMLRKKRRAGSFEVILVILFFAAIIVWFSFGFKDIISSTKNEQLFEVTQSVKKAVVLCYSIEGSFPPDLEYLQDNYGLIINEDIYIVHYSVFASNIMPDIIVFSRK